MADQALMALGLDEKIEKCKDVIREALDKYPLEKIGVAWTAGKDSTLLLYFLKDICAERGIKVPVCFCIDEGDMFDEIKALLDRLTAEWGLELCMLHNSDVSSKAEGLGAPVRVDDLNERNRREVRERLKYEDEEFFYEPESFVGNHLMKTVALNTFLEERGLTAFFEGIRWDEQGARAEETYFSPREGTEFSPAHMRVSPLLHVKEMEIWDMHHKLGVPFCELYKQGFRSLGARVTTRKTGDCPAWEQDLESAPERVGRRQDKEGLMGKLRELGYM
jgi:phosphoadenosine phosphosulfate reductase